MAFTKDSSVFKILQTFTCQGANVIPGRHAQVNIIHKVSQAHEFVGSEVNTFDSDFLSSDFVEYFAGVFFALNPRMVDITSVVITHITSPVLIGAV